MAREYRRRSGGYRDAPMPKRLVIVESPAKARTICRLPRAGLRRRVLRRPHSRPARQRRRDPREVQGGVVGAPRRRRRARLRAPLRRRPRQEEDGRAAQEAARRRRRAPARDGRGSRGRGNRLAPARGAEAEGARTADGLPRDHPPRDRAGARGDARRRRATGGRAGVAADPRPALRLRGIARPLEEDHARPLCRPRPVGCHPPRRRARAGADGVPRRRVVGPGRYVRSGFVRGAARLPRRTARGNGPRLRPRREAARRGAPARRGGGARARRPAPGLLLPASPASSGSRTSAGRARRS